MSTSKQPKKKRKEKGQYQAIVQKKTKFVQLLVQEQSI